MKKIIIFCIVLLAIIGTILIKPSKTFEGVVIITLSPGESKRHAVLLDMKSQYIFDFKEKNNLTISGSYYDIRKIKDTNQLIGCLYNLQTKKYMIDKIEYKNGELNKKATIYESEVEINNPIIENNKLYYRKKNDESVLMYDISTKETIEIFSKPVNEFDIIDGRLIYNQREEGSTNIYIFDIEKGTNKLFKKDASFSSIKYNDSKIVSTRDNIMYITNLYSMDEEMVVFDNNQKLIKCIIDDEEKLAIIHFAGDELGGYETKIYRLSNMQSKTLIEKRPIWIESIVFIK